MWSNMLPKPSISVFSSARSESNNRGGVAVLAVLAVTARSLLLWMSGGRPPGEEAGDDLLAIPKEKVREESRRNPGLADDGGGTGISLYALCPLALSERVSIDEGLVEEVLRRAEEAALSFGAVE
jgi:hypothetical protein